MTYKRVVVKGGGENLYRIYEASGKYWIDSVDVGFISNSYNNIGKTSNLEDAISIIKAHSGKEIDTISEW